MFKRCISNYWPFWIREWVGYPRIGSIKASLLLASGNPAHPCIVTIFVEIVKAYFPTVPSPETSKYFLLEFLYPANYVLSIKAWL